MDMIEYTISVLGFQARGLAECVPNPEPANELLLEAAGVLAKAYGARRSGRAAGLGPVVDDDSREAQLQQILDTERHLADGGIRVRINNVPLPDPRDPDGGRPLEGLRDKVLFDQWAEVMRELKARELIRSTNRPLVGDYAEKLVADALSAKRPEGPDRGVDLVTPDGTEIRVNARRDPDGREATHFDIANLEEGRFQQLIGVHFDASFEVRAAWQMEHKLVEKLATPSGRKHRLRFAAIREAIACGEGIRELAL